MKFSRAKTDAVQKFSGDGVFSVLHTRSYLRKDHVAFREERVAFGNFTKRASFWPKNPTAVFSNGRHLNKGRRRAACPIKFWPSRIQFANLAKFHRSPAGGDRLSPPRAGWGQLVPANKILDRKSTRLNSSHLGHS